MPPQYEPTYRKNGFMLVLEGVYEDEVERMAMRIAPNLWSISKPDRNGLFGFSDLLPASTTQPG